MTVTGPLIAAYNEPLDFYIGVCNEFVQDGAAIQYRLKKFTSSDLVTWTAYENPPFEHDGWGSWDGYTHQGPRILQVGDVLYCYFCGKFADAWANFRIGLARSYDFGRSWIKYSGNPILSATVGWEGNVIWWPMVIYDAAEANPAKRWKMWYAGGTFGTGIGYAYSADGLAWTKYAANPVLGLGAGGNFDDTYIGPDFVKKIGGNWVMLYSGKSGAAWSVGRLTFANPESAYANAVAPILTGDGLTTTITANVLINDTSIQVTDSTGFVAGYPVWVGQDMSTRYLTTVDNVPDPTHIVVTDPAPANYNSGVNSFVRSVAYNSINVREALPDGANYKLSIVVHQPDGLVETGVHEVSMYGSADGNLENPVIDYASGVILPVTVAESRKLHVSRENFSIAHFTKA